MFPKPENGHFFMAEKHCFFAPKSHRVKTKMRHQKTLIKPIIIISKIPIEFRQIVCLILKNGYGKIHD